MKEDVSISIRTSPEVQSALQQIAAEENLSVSAVIESIIYHYLKDNKAIEGIFRNHRRFERKKACIASYIGDPRWQRREFEKCIILDISLFGVRLCIPRGTKLEIGNDSATAEFSVIFSLPNHPWPIQVKCHPEYVMESEEDIQIGAEFVNHDFHAYTALQKYLI